MNEFRRMMQRVLKSNWQEQWVSFCLLALFAGLVFSRAIVSFASVLIVIPYLANPSKTLVKKPLLIAILFILLPVIFSGIHSGNTAVWWKSVSVKLPLLTMMLGLASVSLTAHRWRLLSYAYLLIITAGCIWSTGQYFYNRQAIEASYLVAKVLPTLADGDYVRFSWMVVTAVFLGWKVLVTETVNTNRYFSGLLLLFLIAYLHLLAAKTGLLCLYTGLTVYLAYLLLADKAWYKGFAAMAVVLYLAFVAYGAMPTLRNRIQYVVYDFSNYSTGNIIPGYNDAGRWLSIRAGYDITKNHPLTGVGFGNLPDAVNQWHETHHPGSFLYERFRPACEWLVYGAASGLPGILLFTAGIALLLFYTGTKNRFSVLLSITAVLPLITDDALEGQYGVIILAIISFFGQQTFPGKPEQAHA